MCAATSGKLMELSKGRASPHSCLRSGARELLSSDKHWMLLNYEGKIHGLTVERIS
jgi:hypothetical protein